MRFLTDENISRAVVEMLRSLGHDVLDVREHGMAGATDVQVSNLARSSGRVLVTMDTDFANILHYPPQEYPGVIVLRVSQPTTGRVVDALRFFVTTVDEAEIDHSLFIVGLGTYRVRRAF